MDKSKKRNSILISNSSPGSSSSDSKKKTPTRVSTRPRASTAFTNEQGSSSPPPISVFKDVIATKSDKEKIRQLREKQERENQQDLEEQLVDMGYSPGELKDVVLGVGGGTKKGKSKLKEKKGDKGKLAAGDKMVNRTQTDTNGSVKKLTNSEGSEISNHSNKKNGHQGRKKKKKKK